MNEITFPLDVNGYHFTSWEDANEKLGYVYNYMKSRYAAMKDTHTLEEIFVHKPIYGIEFPLDVNGYHFENWRDAGKQLGYANGQYIKIIFDSMKDTHTLEEIFVPRIKKETIFPLDVNGYHFESWTDADKKLGYKSAYIKSRYTRMKDSHTLEEIFVPAGYGKLFPLDVNGYHFTNWGNAKKVLGYETTETLKTRYEMMKDNFSLEEIFVTSESLLFPLDVNGYHFTSWEHATSTLKYQGIYTLKHKYYSMKDTHPLEDIFTIDDSTSIFPLDVNGYHFTSWKDVGRKLNRSGQYLMKIYIEKKDTHTLEEIFVPKSKDTIFPLDVNGYHFTSWTNASIRLKYPSTAELRNRYESMKNEYSLEEIFIKKLSDEETIFPLDVNGYHFESWADADEQLGYICKGGVYGKYRRNKDKLSLEEIFVPKQQKKTIFPLDVNGYHFESWEDASKQLGYAGGPVMYNIYKRKRDTNTLEEIFVPRFINKIFPLDVNGYHFESWEDAAKLLGYTSTSIYYRYRCMKYTNTLEEIFVPKEEKKTIFPLDVNGYHFESWEDAAVQLGNKLSPFTYNFRYRDGFNIMQTFGFSLFIGNRAISINDTIICQCKISDNLYRCKNRKTKLYELHTYDELNAMWRKFKGIKIVKE